MCGERSGLGMAEYAESSPSKGSDHPRPRGQIPGSDSIFTAKGAKRQREQTMNKTKDEIEQIAEQVVDAMLTVHRALGPGLLESTYQACLAYELRCRGIEVDCEVGRPSDQGRHQADGQWV